MGHTKQCVCDEHLAHSFFCKKLQNKKKNGKISKAGELHSQSKKKQLKNGRKRTNELTIILII